MNGEVFLFTRRCKAKRGDKVLEIGSLNVNGSVRENFANTEYVGIDIRPGKDVDIVMSAVELPEKFPAEHFDVILCCETLEHCEDWKGVIRSAWTVLKTGGRMCITTPTKVKGYHGYPHDYWRFELEDYERIFKAQGIKTLLMVGQRGVGIIVEKVSDSLDMDFEPWRIQIPDKFRR